MLRRRSRLVVVAALCVLAGGVLTGAQAMTPVHKTAPNPAGRSLRVPPPPPGHGWTEQGLTIDRSVQSVKRAKLAFNVKPFRGLSWLRLVYEPGGDYADGTAEIYVTDPGSVDQFGEFAPVRVQALAFGTIPVTATVHISQIRHGNKLVPLVVKVRFTTHPVKPPHPLPCSPPTTADQECSYTDAPHLSGLVDVRVDDVKIDQVPVDVGPDCHTGQPATMSLTADAGYYSVSVNYLPPGIYLPFIGGTLHGPVDVPAFTGCRNGGDDLSAVVSAMVSGPDNELTTHQNGPLVNYPPPPPPQK